MHFYTAKPINSNTYLLRDINEFANLRTMPRGMVKEEKPRGPTAGYPEIERLVDTEDFTEVNEKFQSAYDQLQTVAKQKRGLKKSREAKKAMSAIELVMDLFRELLTIKYRLQEMAKQARSSKTPPNE